MELSLKGGILEELFVRSEETVPDKGYDQFWRGSLGIARGMQEFAWIGVRRLGQCIPRRRGGSARTDPVGDVLGPSATEWRMRELAWIDARRLGRMSHGNCGGSTRSDPAS